MKKIIRSFLYFVVLFFVATEVNFDSFELSKKSKSEINLSYLSDLTKKSEVVATYGQGGHFTYWCGNVYTLCDYFVDDNGNRYYFWHYGWQGI